MKKLTFPPLGRRRDVLLHHPYMRYSHITDFLKEAAEDPDVVAIGRIK